ncbi:hypothetical protein [Polyangium aurulentum]|uniref:hypothetical protein n=1 Tax=Polyangium aurulentum TaxID=2567896 RepID=UPI0010AE682C|nr:hypothetical protein [Polyangium aurulentum]UQA61808.1 hypothetical protein E8A73_015575 [Polyangium aurulentum]
MDKDKEGEIYRSDLYVVSREGGGRVIRLRRTNSPMNDDGLAEIERWYERLFPAFVRPRYGLLLDSREAPLIEDPALEQRMFDTGTRLFAGFSRGAILVGTAEGKLQASLLSRSRGITVPVFSREEDALEFLVDGIPVSRKL